MQNTTFRKGLLASSSALKALALVGAGVAASAGAIAPAAAQDYTSGAITGTVTDEAGNPVSGATVVATSNATGQTRTATTGANGNFRLNALPTGSWDIVVTGGGFETFTATGVNVLASQQVGVDIAVSSANVITVLGTQIVNDFEGTTTGLNVDVEELTQRVPLPNDLTSVVLLAPGTTQGDSAFGNLASIGGSSVAENAYYINGLNITNFDNYLGSARVPFDFYRSVETKTGGYPAEFGRATGGIINAVTKSGSNDVFGGVHLDWSPSWGASDGEDLQTCVAADNCFDITNRDADESESYSAVFEAGLPLIKDRLFVYGLIEFRRTENTTVNVSSGTATQNVQDDPFYGIKVDAYPIDSQHFEFTLFDTRRQTVQSTADYVNTGGDEGFSIGSYSVANKFNFGGVNYVGKYTGTFTDWLTISAAYGVNEDRFDSELVGSTQPFVLNSNSNRDSVGGVAFGGRYNDQTAASVDQPYSTKREFYRADVDLFFNLFGSHHIRAGFDTEDNTLARGTVRTGGEFLLGTGDISDEAFNAGAGSAGIAYVLQEDPNFDPDNPDDTSFWELNYFNSGGTFTSTNRAFYIQDEWRVTDRLVVNLGVRRDDFNIRRPDGLSLANLEENYAPRLGFTYDIGDNGQLFGSFGQYFLPIASNTAFRQAGTEFFFRERFEADPDNLVDGNGVPILGDQVEDQGNFQQDCPFGLTPNSSGENCLVTGDGSVPETQQAISQDLKATRESEYIIGYNHDFGGFNLGIAYIHRNLDRSAEDVSVDPTILAFCADQGIDDCEDTWVGFHQYVILNPGFDATFEAFVSPGEGGDELVDQFLSFSAEELGYPKAKRTYDAVEFTFDRPWDGKWGLTGSYTWSRSFGNSEGFVQSDFGQDDAGITQDFDVVEFTDFAEGRLPNDRTHRFKLFGSYAPIEQVVLGGNVSVTSPRPLSCFGYHPTAAIGNLYGAASRYCGLEPFPRGTGLESDWIYNVDLSARYNIDFNGGNRLSFTAGVFNVLNSQGITQRDEIGDASVVIDEGDPDTRLDNFPTSVSPNPNYGTPTGYQAPRQVRFSVDVLF